MTRHPLAFICPDTLRPMSEAEVYRRAARREQIAAMQRRVAKASESRLPADERRQVVELRAMAGELAVAAIISVPATIGALWWMVATL